MTVTSRMFGALVGLLVAASAALPIAATESADSGASDGVIRPSMVEMLDESHAGGVVTMAELREDTLGSRGHLASGAGIDVALIDTGVSPVSGLDGDKVLHGPDLSGEGSSPEVAYLDTYGHGTHMAGIIAGDRPGHEGIAPDARIVSVKVAGHDGITSVPQVVAAIDWVIEHRNADGLNIRVLNLSLGLADVDDHRGDALSAAVERAWDAGIFVVVAAGNSGDSQPHLDSPAIDPYVLAVGAADQMSHEVQTERDVPSWSARGEVGRDPDLVAPGRSIASYRVPGSTIDLAAPHARYGDDFFLGSGTSQSAAVMSGLAAAIIARYPWTNPDRLKYTIVKDAESVRGFGRSDAGNGHVEGWDSIEGQAGNRTQYHDHAAGPGTGLATPSGATWSGGTWSGATWSGATWSGATWSGGTWSGATWSGATWSGATWSGATWSGATWSGATWSGATWSGATWSGATWSGHGWTS
ncbi:MAG: S8 family serine peptidase [Actinomycetota bacterium]